ncbi:MAG: inositol monophosphatase family protein [Anaerolineae bacterium]
MGQGRAHADSDAAPSPAELRLWLDEATDIARRAGELVADRYSLAHQETQKGHAHNLVTETDHASEELIVGEVARRFPGHSIRAEEGRDRAGADIVWVVDPLDGTNNFAHGFPVFAVSMAAMREGDVLVGVTYDPLRDELFAGVRGGGATLNGRPLAVSARSNLAESLVATGFPYDKATNPDNNVPQFAAVAPRVRGIRRAGSAALDLAYVAAGRLEAYWERGTNAWDVAAGILFVLEAGGEVTDYDGRAATVDGGRFVASNGRVHDELVSRLKAASAQA